MKTIGLIGGMSWESTLPYYRQVNQTVKRHLGGLHSAKVVLYSVDFHQIERLQHAGDWDAAGALLADAARALQAAGADFLVLCTNTMHKVAPAIEAAVTIPLFHIADRTMPRATTTAASSPRWWRRARRPSSSAAPKSRCWWRSRTPPCRCSTPPPSTPPGRRNGRFNKRRKI